MKLLKARTLYFGLLVLAATIVLWSSVDVTPAHAAGPESCLDEETLCEDFSNSTKTTFETTDGTVAVPELKAGTPPEILYTTIVIDDATGTRRYRTGFPNQPAVGIPYTVSDQSCFNQGICSSSIIDVELTVFANDKEDGQLVGKSISWTVFDTDGILQPRVFSGGTMSARLFLLDYFSTKYEVHITATDSDGNYDSHVLYIDLLCMSNIGCGGITYPWE